MPRTNRQPPTGSRAAPRAACGAGSAGSGSGLRALAALLTLLGCLLLLTGVSGASLPVATTADNLEPQQQQQQQLLKQQELIYLQAPEASELQQDDQDDALILVLAEPEPTANRRLRKRSGISDHRLAEIQMIRALKKQLERASKLAASSSMSPVAAQPFEQELTS